MATQVTDEWMPKLEGLQTGLDAAGKPIYYPEKARESHRLLWRAAYELRRRPTLYSMEFQLPAQAGYSGIFPYPSGEALVAFAFAGVPPQGQPMLIDVRTGGASIFATPLAIVEGFAESVKVTEFVRDPVRAKEGDVFTPVILQSGTIVPGGLVTVVVIWKVVLPKLEV